AIIGPQLEGIYASSRHLWIEVLKHFNSGITFCIYKDRELAAEEANLALEAVQYSFNARECIATQERRPMAADNQQVVIYTDGSSRNGRIGAAIAIPLNLHQWRTQVKPIASSENLNEYTAELFAILLAFHTLTNRIPGHPGYTPLAVTIFSDC
ncbi:hypothetical protein V502_02605, partial [Pseudogymnoascus sp. VKM F-4520 (FW-2644)]